MIKKIKDLTLEEHQKICSKYNVCIMCPLLYKCLERTDKDIDESEVEVDAL